MSTKWQNSAYVDTFGNTRTQLYGNGTIHRYSMNDKSTRGSYFQLLDYILSPELVDLGSSHIDVCAHLTGRDFPNLRQGVRSKKYLC